MRDRWPVSMGALVVLAAWSGLGGCAGSSARLPECKGNAVPINRGSVAEVSGVPREIGDSRTASTGTAPGGARDAQ